MSAYSEEYVHVVHYYETDRMGITHHSNYIRWMEETRVDFLQKIGWGYDKLEEIGLICPVVGVECKYKETTTFSDRITIKAYLEEFKGVKMIVKYIMENEAGKVVCEGRSEHCFLNREGKIVRVNKEFPDFYDAMVKWGFTKGDR